MKRTAVLAVALIALIHLTVAFRKNPKLPIMLFGRPQGGFMNYPDEIRQIHQRDDIDYNDCSVTPELVQDNFTQQVDHSNASQGTYQQRYWYNPKYKNDALNPDGPLIFLMVEGESIAGCKWVTNPGYQYLQWAAKYGAHVFQLEHRFFGYSRPRNDQTYESLKLLTMSQALDDVATFIDGITAKYNFVNPKWVTFGGSYPGVLNALFRQKYPSKTVGAIGSSAGLKYKLDMYEYAMNVEIALGRNESNCTATIDAAWKQMVQLALSTEGRQTLNTIFNIQPPFDENTTQLLIDNFFANLYGYYQDVTQYTYDGRDSTTMGGKNIANLCNIMNNGTEPNLVQRVRNFINWVDAFGGATAPVPFDNDYNKMMSILSNTSFVYDTAYADPDFRGWMWLCCNEIGLLQTTDQGRNIFQQTVPINYFFDMCTDIFDPELTAVEIQRRVDVTTNTYGGLDNYQGSKIVLPSGELDPWHTLALNTDHADRQITTILVAGGAHCSDMYPRWNGEAAAQQAVRDLIESQLKIFIGK